MAKLMGKKRSSSGENWLFLHLEKIIFVVLLLLAGWMITRGSGLESFNIKPEEIRDAASRADERIKRNEVGPKDVDSALEVYNYSEYSRLIKSSLKVAPYKTAIRWEQSLFPDKVKRPDIVPLPVENLIATAGVGAISYLSEDGYQNRPAGGAPGTRVGGLDGPSATAGTGTKEEGRHWITITGLIPVGKELRAYGEKFGGTQYTDLQRDVPQYLFYEIQRGIKGEDGQIAWSTLDLNKTYEDEVDHWSSIGADPVSPYHEAPLLGYDYPRLTMSCPPLVNKRFGEEVANPPKIPLLSDEQMSDYSDFVKEQKRYEEELKKLGKRNFDAARKQSIFDNQQAAGPNQGGAMSSDFDNDSPTRLSRRLPNGAVPGVQNIGMRSPEMTASQSSVDDYYLFRHFDFDVVEGVTYYYRVKLFLANPNYGLDVNLVEDTNTVGQMEISTDYSESSNPVALGRESRILAETIESPTRPGLEPKITIASIFFNTEDAKESIVHEKKVVRGQVANFLKEQHKPVELSGAGVAQGVALPTKNDRKNRTMVDHISDICVLDAIGGNVVPGTDLRNPSVLLVLQPSGLIDVHSLSEDQRELKDYSGEKTTGTTPSGRPQTGGVSD